MRLISSFILLFLWEFVHPQATKLFENDICYTKGERGFCKRFDKCSTARSVIRAGKRPKICGFVSGEDLPIICCTQDSNRDKQVSRVATPPTVPIKSNSTLIAQRNDICYSHGERGFCKRFDKCSTARSAIRAGKRPKICGFVSGEDHPIICCPLEPNRDQQVSRVATPPTVPLKPNSTLIAQRKCKEYSKSIIVEIDSPVLLDEPLKKDKVDLCAMVAEPLIIGGEKAKPREYPHMVLVGYSPRPDGLPQWLCGGSLISERFVLSAAHCVAHPRKGPARWAKLGELDTSSDFEDAQPEIFKITERINHPKYSPSTLYNDISLFKLEKDVRFNAYIRPICLSTRDDTPWKVIATGWGHTSWRGGTSAPLKKVSLNTVDIQTCNDNYTSVIGIQIPQGILKESMICAGDNAGDDTCQGDSGGPIQVALNDPYCMYNIVGVTSFGKNCGKGFPGVYTKVSHFVPWIVEIVWPNEK